MIFLFNREHPSSPKHSPHPHSPSSSSSGHSSPRSPPSHPPAPSSHPPPLPHHSRSSTTAKQRPAHQSPHSSPSHAPRSKSHDLQYSYHGDPNKAGSSWKSTSASRGHSRVSAGGTKNQHTADGVPMAGDPKMTEPNDRGSPSGASSSGSSHSLQQRHHDPLPPSSLHHSSSSSDHVTSRQHHQRFSPEGIQAETGERGGGKNDTKPSRNVEALLGQPAASSCNAPGKAVTPQRKTSLASVSCAPQGRLGTQSGGLASEGGEGKGVRGGREVDPKDVIQMNHVALRVAQFNQSNNSHSDEGNAGEQGEGVTAERSKEKTPSPNEVRSPELEKAAIITLSPGSSEEELNSINKEESEGGKVEESDGGCYPLKSEAFSGGSAGSVTHPQLSQPTYLIRTPPTAPIHPPFPHNPASYPSLSQPHPSHTYESTTAHSQMPQFGTHATPHMVAGVPYDPSKKGHPLPPSQHHQKHPSHSHQQHQPHPPYRTHPNQPLPPHQRSHEHHVTGHPGSHDHHMIVHPGSHDHHIAYAAVDPPQHRGYRQQGPAHPQRRVEHNIPVITKQNLIRAHEAAANGDLTTLVSFVSVVSVSFKFFSLLHSLPPFLPPSFPLLPFFWFPSPSLPPSLPPSLLPPSFPLSFLTLTTLHPVSLSHPSFAPYSATC